MNNTKNKAILILLICLFNIHQYYSTKLKICFHTNELNVRGTTIAVYDYAHYNEVLLNHTSIIVLPRNNEVVNGKAYKKFTDRFKDNFHIYDQVSFMDTVKQLHCDMVYICKAGFRQSKLAFNQFTCGGPPTLVHAVFDNGQRHGTVFAMIYEGLVDKQIRPGFTNLHVPYMITTPDPNFVKQSKDELKLREKYNISKEALVICRHGGSLTFQVKFVLEAICILSRKYVNTNQLHFLFLGTKKWNDCTTDNKITNIHFMESTSSDIVKEAYFSECDVMLHARSDGETFGVAIAEASVRNIPVLYRFVCSIYIH